MVSIFLIVSHLPLLILLLVLFLTSHLLRQEFTTSLGIIVPMLSGFTMLAVTYVISVKEKKRYVARSEALSGIYVFATLLFPTVFILTIAALVVMKWLDVLSFENFKLALGATETIFAGYTGKLLASLFGKEDST